MGGKLRLTPHARYEVRYLNRDWEEIYGMTHTNTPASIMVELVEEFNRVCQRTARESVFTISEAVQPQFILIGVHYVREEEAKSTTVRSGDLEGRNPSTD